MQPRLHHRLQQLEKANRQLCSQAVMRDREAGLERAQKYVQLFINARGIEQEGNESFMETWARALGISLRDLRETLAAGIDPIRKCFEENGIYEEIERRKAAGTWPSG